MSHTYKYVYDKLHFLCRYPTIKLTVNVLNKYNKYNMSISVYSLFPGTIYETLHDNIHFVHL